MTSWGEIAYHPDMVSALSRLVATTILVLALCVPNGIVSAVATMHSPADTCCPAEAPGTEEGSDNRCTEPGCQCLSCLSIVVHDLTVALPGLSEPGRVHFEPPPALTGEVYRTIDYPPEVA